MSELIRVNTRIPKKMNEWLDQQSSESGVPKSTLIYLALEKFHEQKIAIEGMAGIMKELEEVKQRLPVGE